MARVRYIGPHAKRRVEFANGTAQTVSRGDVIEVSDDEAASLVNTGAPRMWEAADGGMRSFTPSPISETQKKSHHKGKEER